MTHQRALSLPPPTPGNCDVHVKSVCDKHHINGQSGYT
jgi:hypothetical protein